MWLLTKFGFFSVVEKPEDKPAGTLTVRARVRSDLEALRDRYLPHLTDITENERADYRYRARVSRSDLANAAAAMVRDVDYSNFKVSVAEHQGSGRASVYHDVWESLTRLQRPESPTFQVSMRAAAGGRACGGVLIDDEGRVLLREPTRHFDDFVWTFPSALRKEGESEESAAVRAVLEDAGFPARVVQRLAFSGGGRSDDVFFTMRTTGSPVAFRFERTQALRWAEPVEAKKLIQQTTNAEGRARDLAVLAAALAASAESATEPGDGAPM